VSLICYSPNGYKQLLTYLLYNIKHVISKKVDRMAIAIYFHEMPTQQNALGISKRIGDRNGETAITCVREAKPNSKIETKN